MGIRQRCTPGAIVEIPLPNKTLAYAQILDPTCDFAYFDYNPRKPLEDVGFLDGIPCIFIACTHATPVAQGHWQKVGKLPLREEFINQPNRYMQDGLDIRRFTIVEYATGVYRPATRAECVGLEVCAVYAQEHIETRLMEYFTGISGFLNHRPLGGGFSYAERCLIHAGHLSPEYDPWNPDIELLKQCDESLRNSGSCANKRNAISPKNPNYDRLIKAAKDEFNIPDEPYDS